MNILVLLTTVALRQAPFAPCEVGAVEPSIVTQVPESGKQKNTFQKVISLIRKKENDLKVPELESSFALTISGVEEPWSSSSSASPLVHLPMSKMVERMLQAVEFEVTDSTDSLASRRYSLLPLLSHKKQTYWYKLLDDKDLASH